MANKTMAEDPETLRKNLNQNEPIAMHTHLGTDGKENETSGNDMEKEKFTKKKRNRKNALETGRKSVSSQKCRKFCQFSEKLWKMVLSKCRLQVGQK